MRDDEASILDMVLAAKDAVAYAGSDRAAYMADSMRQLAVERMLEIVGEAARRVSEEYRSAHPEIPWREMIALRNVISHKYDEVDRQRIWDLAQEEIPELIANLEPLAPKEADG